jgi:hypothetical protein
MNNYLLKEYGSWGVMTLSFLAGMLVGGTLHLSLIPAYIAAGLLINSKQALTLWVRSTGRVSATHARVFFLQVVPAALVLFFLLKGGLAALLPFAAIPVIYLMLNRLAGEHAISTEIAGFALLSAAAPVSRFLSSGLVDYRLFGAVALFFCAGVFKVRIQFRKRIRDRAVMVAYLLGAVTAYYLIRAPLLALFPLADNLIFAIAPYRVRVRITGWTEVVKGSCFLLVMALAY